MNDLDMIKAFSGLKGVELVPHAMRLFYYNKNGWLSIDGVPHSEYNPITDLALNCAARDKYKVEIDYEDKEVSIWGGKPEYMSVATVPFKDNPNKAVIECVLKSEGLCDEN